MDEIAPFEIKFNPTYLSKAVNSCNCDEIVLLASDPGSPSIMRPADDTGITIVLMPKR